MKVSKKGIKQNDEDRQKEDAKEAGDKERQRQLQCLAEGK